MSFNTSTVGLFAVLLLTCIAYWPTLDNGFPYDDAHVAQAHHSQLGANRMVAELRPVAEYFTTEYWRGAGAASLHSSPLYRPVTVYSIALTHALWSGDGTLSGEAFPHHFGNLLLQLLNTLLVFLLARRFTADAAATILAAAVFGLSAVHTEAIATVVGRADLLACAFGAAALLVILHAPGAGARQVLAVSVAGCLLFLAFCSKESALAWWPFAICASLARSMGAARGGQPGAAWMPWVVGLLPCLAWWFLRDHTFADLPETASVAYPANPLQYVPTGQRLLAGLAIQGYGIGSIFAPVQLACDYGAAVFPFAEPGQGFDLRACSYLGLWLGVLGLGIHAAIRPSPLAFLTATALLGFGIATSNLLQVIGTIHADRLTYLPSLGAAWSVLYLLQFKRLRTAALVGTSCWCLANGILGFDRAQAYRDNNKLFLTDVERQPDSLNLRLQAAAVEQQRGDWAKWRVHLEAARRLRPEWARPMIELAAGRTLLARQRAPAEEPARTRYIVNELRLAEQLLRLAQKSGLRSPDDDKRLAINLGSVLVQLGESQAADRCFEAILARNPTDIALRHTILINAADGLTDAQFLSILTAGERWHPESMLLKMHRGLRSARQSRWGAARRELEAALPGIAAPDAKVHQAWLVLAGVLGRTGDTEASRRMFRMILADRRFPAGIRQQAAAQLK